MMNAHSTYSIHLYHQMSKTLLSHHQNTIKNLFHHIYITHVLYHHVHSLLAFPSFFLSKNSMTYPMNQLLLNRLILLIHILHMNDPPIYIGYSSLIDSILLLCRPMNLILINLNYIMIMSTLLTHVLLIYPLDFPVYLLCISYDPQNRNIYISCLQIYILRIYSLQPNYYILTPRNYPTTIIYITYTSCLLNLSPNTHLEHELTQHSYYEHILSEIN